MKTKTSNAVLTASLLVGAALPIQAFHIPTRLSSFSDSLQLVGTSSIVVSKDTGISSSRSRCSRPTYRRSTRNDDTGDPYASSQLDTDALTKYALAAIIQLTLFSASFQLIDYASDQLILGGGGLPFPAVTFLFYVCSLKSRVFNPLNNQRPNRSKAVDGEGSAGFRDRIMPSWTPPGVLFPIMWLLIIGPIRAYSSALVVMANGSFFTLPTMAFIAHLTIGDIWNTINNTEKRYGAAVIGVLCVVLSAANAAFQYSTVDPTAGKLLGGTCLWLVTAAALITDTWRLNPSSSGQRVPLYPVKGEAETSFQ